MNFEGKKILITGGTRGIGAATAKVLSAYGARVTVTGRSESNSTEYSYIPADFAEHASIANLLSEIEGGDFFGIVNNAGINEVHTIEDFPQSSYEQIFQVNFNSVYQILQASARSFISRKSEGRIVNIGSIWATHTKVGRSAYCAAKAGVAGMTRAVATDLAKHNVLVNTLSPGFIETELTRKTMGQEGIDEVSTLVPMSRLGRPEEIGETVAFLLSPKNTYLTGQNIIVDGGFTNV